jgi:hypothetical protein
MTKLSTIQTDFKKWEKRVDLPPRSHLFRDPSGWILPTGDHLTKYDLEKPELAGAFLPKLDFLLKEKEQALQKMEEEWPDAENDSPEAGERRGMVADDIKADFRKKLYAHALQSGLLQITSEKQSLTVIGRANPQQMEAIQLLSSGFQLCQKPHIQ